MTLVKLVVDYLPEGSALVYEKLMGLLEEVLWLLISPLFLAFG